MSISTLNATLRDATETTRSGAPFGSGSDPLDEVLVSDLYADSSEGSATTSFITMIDAPTTMNCTKMSTCSCASVDDEFALPADFAL